MRPSDSRTGQFLDLLEPVKGALERYAIRNSWNREQAHDIVQEAVMTAWREFHRFQLGTDFKAWIFRVLVNTVYSFNKRVTRERQHRTMANPEELHDVLEREDAWAGVLQCPEKIFEALDERVVNAIGCLSVEEKQCLMLRILDGFAYKEISALMAIPMGTVMSHVHRARIKLRERLAELALEEGLLRGPSHELS